MEITRENTKEDNNRNRYECHLAPELLAKAVRELGEPECNLERLAAIDELHVAFAETAIGSELGRLDDRSLLRYLRAAKFDQGKALALLEYYHSERRDWRWVFDIVAEPSRLSATMMAGCVAQLPGRARDGSAAICFRIGGQNDVRIEDLIACLVLITEKLCECEATQIDGITVIMDLSEVGFGLARQATLAVIRRCVALIQKGMPMRLKGLHFVHEPLIFSLILAIGKSFLNDKLRRRLHTHGSDLSRLSQFVDQDFLPGDYVGNGPPLDSQNRAEWFLGLQS